eukprot:213420-Pelagomonas_calceolata.AAC.2
MECCTTVRLSQQQQQEQQYRLPSTHTSIPASHDCCTANVDPATAGSQHHQMDRATHTPPSPPPPMECRTAVWGGTRRPNASSTTSRPAARASATALAAAAVCCACCAWPHSADSTRTTAVRWFTLRGALLVEQRSSHRQLISHCMEFGGREGSISARV